MKSSNDKTQSHHNEETFLDQEDEDDITEENFEDDSLSAAIRYQVK